MRYTNNLQLPIIEDTDAFSSLFTMNNETNNKLEEKFGDIPQFKEAVTSMQDDVNTSKADIERLKTSETDLSNRITMLEDVKNKTDITVAGVKKSGTHHRVKLTVTPNTTNQVVQVPIYNNDTDGLFIRSYTANVTINMNEVLGINSLDNIIMLGVGTYQSSHKYQGSTNVIPMSLRDMGKAPGSDNLTMFITGTYTDISKQPLETSTVSAYPQSGDVEIIIEYMVLD